MATALNDQQKQLVQKFTQSMEKYEEKTLPDLLREHNIKPAKFKHICITELKKSQKLQIAFTQSPMSLFASILFLAEIGLTPDEAIGEAFLFSFYNGDTKKNEIKPIIGYHGIIAILLRSGALKTIDSNCVFEGDEFSYELGLNPVLRHIPNHDAVRNSSTFKYAYAVAVTDSGEKIFRVMSKKEIEAVRDSSKYPNNLYFNDKKDMNFWMPQKTVLIQLSKLLKKDWFGSKAIRYDSALEGGAAITLDEENNNAVKLVEGVPLKISRYRNIYDTLAKVEDAQIVDDIKKED